MGGRSDTTALSGGILQAAEARENEAMTMSQLANCYVAGTDKLGEEPVRWGGHGGFYGCSGSVRVQRDQCMPHAVRRRPRVWVVVRVRLRFGGEFDFGPRRVIVTMPSPVPSSSRAHHPLPPCQNRHHGPRKNRYPPVVSPDRVGAGRSVAGLW